MGRDRRLITLLGCRTLYGRNREVRLILSFLEVSILATNARRRVLTTTLSRCVTIAVRNSRITKVVPSILVSNLLNDLLVLMMARRRIEALNGSFT